MPMPLYAADCSSSSSPPRDKHCRSVRKSQQRKPKGESTSLRSREGGEPNHSGTGSPSLSFFIFGCQCVRLPSDLYFDLMLQNCAPHSLHSSRSNNNNNNNNKTQPPTNPPGNRYWEIDRLLGPRGDLYIFRQLSLFLLLLFFSIPLVPHCGKSLRLWVCVCVCV